jgi:hypothetical protein
MILCIERVNNGFILTNIDDSDKVINVIEIDEDETQAAIKLANFVINDFNLEGSKFSDSRPYVVAYPGTKSDKIPDECPLCGHYRKDSAG